MSNTTAGVFPIKRIVIAGLIAGSLDIISACLDAWLSTGTAPEKVLRFIAGAAFGKEAATGNFLMPAAGLAFHFIIAMSFTFLFYFIYPSMKKILQYKLAIAVVYAIFMWATMRFLVLPLSLLHLSPLILWKVVKAVLILTAAIGLPLTFLMPWIMTGGATNRKNA